MPYKNPKNRNYKKDYETQKKRNGGSTEGPARRKRRLARYEAQNPGKDGKVTDKVNDGVDIDHKKPLSKGGTNAPGNLRRVSPSKNRSFSRNSDHSVKENKPKKRTKKA
jgi:hypothetical protein